MATKWYSPFRKKAFFLIKIDTCHSTNDPSPRYLSNKMKTYHLYTKLSIRLFIDTLFAFIKNNPDVPQLRSNRL